MRVLPEAALLGLAPLPGRLLGRPYTEGRCDNLFLDVLILVDFSPREVTPVAGFAVPEGRGFTVVYGCCVLLAEAFSLRGVACVAVAGRETRSEARGTETPVGIEVLLSEPAHLPPPPILPAGRLPPRCTTVLLLAERRGA